MNFEIVGSGSMGLLYGAKLAKSNYSVHCWCRSSEQADILKSEGITLQELGGEDRIKVKVSASTIGELELDNVVPEYAQHSNKCAIDQQIDLNPVFILVAVKQPQIDKQLIHHLAILCERFNNNVCVVALQNGIGHIEQLRKGLPTIPLLTMISSEGAKRENSTTIQHTGHGTTTIGNEQNAEGHIELQKILHKALQKAGFSIFMSKSIKEQIYQKLLTNSIINPLTAIYHVTNGQLPEDPIRYKLMRSLFEESCYILNLEGEGQYQFDFESIIQVCHNTSSNYSSMLQDILNHRKTEIQAINGALVSLAYTYGKRAPINESLVQLIETIQH